MNAREELNNVLIINGKESSDIEWAIIDYGLKRVVLNKDYTEDQYIDFLTKLHFEYDNGFGGQELFGEVVFNDGTWLERGEYDGSEWWDFKKCPDFDETMNKSIREY